MVAHGRNRNMAITLTQELGNVEDWGVWSTYTATSTQGPLENKYEMAVFQFDSSGGPTKDVALWIASGGGGKVGTATVDAPRGATVTAYVVGRDKKTGVIATGPLSNTVTWVAP